MLRASSWHRHLHQAAQQHDKSTVRQARKKPSNRSTFMDFLGPTACIAKVAPKMSSRTHSGRLRAGPGERGGLDSAKRLQARPKTGPRAAGRAPGRAPRTCQRCSERPCQPPWAHLAPKRPPKASRSSFGTPGSIFEPSGRSFSKHRGRRKPSANKSAHAKHAMHLS